LGGGSGAGAARSGAKGETGSTREILVRGRRLLGSPVPGVTNKFVITEAEAWFLLLEEGETAPPPLAEVVQVVLGENFHDEDLDAKVDDGRVMLGYVREGGEVEVHTLLDEPSPAVRAKLREVFGREVEGMESDPAGGDAR